MSPRRLSLTLEPVGIQSSMVRVNEAADRFTDAALPGINLAINQAFSHNQAQFVTTTLPLLRAHPLSSDSSVLVNPVLVTHLKKRGIDSFRGLQAQATQILYDNRISLLFISPTGKCLFSVSGNKG
jgi:hypothetical protein